MNRYPFCTGVWHGFLNVVNALVGVTLVAAAVMYIVIAFATFPLGEAAVVSLIFALIGALGAFTFKSIRP